MSLDVIRPYLVAKPHPLIGAETVQLILIREVLDYTVLRTEEDRKLNEVVTPASIKQLDRDVSRVAFLATKQKAAESRQLEALLRTARRHAGLEERLCYLKDNLCMACPRCGLFGATSTESGQTERANIKHRIEYSTAFSLKTAEEVSTATTFNAINDRNETTGQALGDRFAVAPASLFPSVVTLKSVTEHELILAVKVLLSCHSYGAESRIGGDVRNHIIGVTAGWEEIVSALELTLELNAAEEPVSPKAVADLLERNYKALAAIPEKVIILAPDNVEKLVADCAAVKLDKPFLESAYREIAEYRNVQTAKK
jgi:CRISPR type I-D-associated protein Csc2